MKAALSALLLAMPLLAAAQAAPPPAEDPLAALQAAYAQAVTPGEQADVHRELFATVLRRVQRSYARDVDLPALTAAARKAIEPLPAGVGEPAEVFRKAMAAGLRTLDPYTRYLDARTHSNERDASAGFGGVGLELEASEGAVRVVAPMAGTPAARAGVLAGDLIVRVDDASLANLPLPEAMARMRGQPGTPVSLTIRRAGLEAEFTVSLTRDTIRRQLLQSSMEGDVLVLRLSSFGGAVGAALERAVAQALATGEPRAVVLDLRGNPGGLLREAVLAADAFLGQGDIVSVRGRAGVGRTWQADASQLLAGLPMVVLVDRRSASASELVAAALQENGRARVMGQRSFGKGTVQSVMPLGGQQGAVKVTTAIYHGPSGRTVQGVGVWPDIELVAPVADPRTLPEAGVVRAPALRVQQERCAAGKAADPGLACALALLRAGDVQAFAAGLGDDPVPMAP